MRRLLIWVGVPVALIGLGVGLALFEPWRAFTSSHLDEPVPVAAPVSTDTTSPPRPEVLAEGTFVSQEHDTSGTARVLALPDGSRVLRLAGFSTSDGPDVHVWLSDATAGGDWHSYDDGRYVPLGEIKATDGNHNYAIPADADLAGLRSAVIWCDRFNVAFGSAPLAL
ncbi:DM13 domain-containing protein [Actinophytocola sp. KF-1]